jgi:hypothetical protein
MDIHAYARVLVGLRGQDLSVWRYLGARWIGLKAGLVLVGIVALLGAHRGTRYFGVFVLGYVLGASVAGIRSLLVSKRRWLLQQELYDWVKIEALAKGGSGSVDRPGENE